MKPLAIIAKPIAAPPSLLIPLVGSRIRAGFPSPAADYLEDWLDLNELLVGENKETCFFVRVEGDSMIELGIMPGNLLVVDRSIEPQHGHIVIAIVDGEFTLKRLAKKGKKVALVAANTAYPPIVLSGEQQLEIFAVVRSSIQQFLVG